MAPTSFGGLFAPTGVPADVMAKLQAGCRISVQQTAYVEMAKRLHQGSRYYADATAFAKTLEQDVEDKRLCCSDWACRSNHSADVGMSSGHRSSRPGTQRHTNWIPA